MRRGQPSRTQAGGKGTLGPKGGRLTQLCSELNGAPPVQRLKAQGEALASGRPNRTGLPDGLKKGVESLSGMSMDHVRVHRNSSRPAQMQAHAYAQGGDIHLGPGQDHHLPHEAWHVVQQAQGRVRPTMQLAAGVPVNDDKSLEAEATRMGDKALGAPVQRTAQAATAPSAPVVQRAVWESDKNLKWTLFDGDPKSAAAPNVNATAPGEFYDDRTGQTFEDAYEFAHHLSSQTLSATDLADENETLEYENVDEGSDEEEEEEELKSSASDQSMDSSSDMEMEDRRKLAAEALQRPVTSSILTGATGKHPTRSMATHDKFATNKRTKKSGPVTITLEELTLWVQDKPVKRERPIMVEGLVEPTSTKGRGGAPDPHSGVQVYSGAGKQPKLSVASERNTGIPDSERGHIMALELGGPDISQNIVPQWAKFQGSGVWRRMEVAVLKKAVDTQRAGGELKYKVEVFYKDTKTTTPTLRTFGFPTGFRATTQVIGAKGKAPSPITIDFHQGQAQDETDQMMSERKLKKAEGKDWDPDLDIKKKSPKRRDVKTESKARSKAADKGKGKKSSGKGKEKTSGRKKQIDQRRK